MLIITNACLSNGWYLQASHTYVKLPMYLRTYTLVCSFGMHNCASDTPEMCTKCMEIYVMSTHFVCYSTSTVPVKQTVLQLLDSYIRTYVYANATIHIFSSGFKVWY